MSKAFTRESDDAPETGGRPPRVLELPPGARNYLTPEGARRLREELDDLTRSGRRDAAGDGASRHEIDVRIHELAEHIERGEVVEPPATDDGPVRFGASVTLRDDDDREHRFRIVGLPEADPRHGAVSWLSPVARALLGAGVGDVVALPSPHGPVDHEIVAVAYER